MVGGIKTVFDRQVGFAIGTGRCGTKFLANVLSLEPSVSSVHERNPLNEAFHRYCKYYSLPVDDEGFMNAKLHEIQGDFQQNQFSFESSAYLSLSVRQLYLGFGAKFVFLVRSPERVVNSYLQKGWYEKPIVRLNHQLGLGYQRTDGFEFFLSRIVPSGQEFLRWTKMSRVGKLAWYWNMLNAAVLAQFKHIPETHWRIQRLEDLSHSGYLGIAQFFGFQPTISREAYVKLAKSRPNALTDVPTIASWSSVERAEFEQEVAPMAEELAYEYRVDRLQIPQSKQSTARMRASRKMRELMRPIVAILAERYLN